MAAAPGADGVSIENAERAARRRLRLGMSLLVAGFALILGTPATVLWLAVPYPLSFGLLLAVIAPSVALMVVGVTIADEAYRRLARPDLPLGPASQVTLRLHRRRAWIPMVGAIALWAPAGLLAARLGLSVGASLLLAGMGLAFVSFYLWLRTLELERRLRLGRAGAD